MRPGPGQIPFLGFLYVGRRRAAAEHGPHVGLRLPVGRDAFVAPHGPGPGVVGGQRENGPELVGEAAQVGDAGVDVLPRVEGVGDAQVALRTGHQLHQALGAGGRLRGCAVSGLYRDNGVYQVRVDTVASGGGVDDVGERPAAGLGRGREQGGADEDRQEREPTAAETRRRHGEREPYHIAGRTPRWTAGRRRAPVPAPRREVYERLKKALDGSPAIINVNGL